MNGFNYREIPAIKLMKKYIAEGMLGLIFTCGQELGGARTANPERVLLEWRMQQKLSGTGALADFGCHMLDLADYLSSFVSIRIGVPKQMKDNIGKGGMMVFIGNPNQIEVNFKDINGGYTAYKNGTCPLIAFEISEPYKKSPEGIRKIIMKKTGNKELVQIAAMDKEERNKIIKLLKQKLSIHEIEKAIGISRGVISRIV